MDRTPVIPPRLGLEEAAGLLPEVRAILVQLAVERRRLETNPVGREDVADGMRALVELLDARGVQLRDLDRGLVDIAGELNGAPIWWCWRLEEPEIGFWHRLDEGFAHRRHI